jgi:hypothetical protein
MTLTDLYRKALERLEVVSAGESADPDDTTLIADKYAALYAMLLTMRLVAWAADDEVPDYAVMPLTSMLAFAAATEFGEDQNRFADGVLGASPPSLAEQQLRRQLAKNYVSNPATSEYF